MPNTADAPTPLRPHPAPRADLATAARASNVPGALGLENAPAEPWHAGGIEWTAADCGPWASPIGAALALEIATGRA